MGRKAKSSHLKLLDGNPGKKKILLEPEAPDGIPDPPVCLDIYAREEWDRIITGLSCMGIVSPIDQNLLAAYCSAYSRWRTAEEEIQKRVAKGGPLMGLVDITKAGNVIQNCLVGISNKAAADMVRFASEFGGTPAARARLAVDPVKGKKSKFDGLIGVKK